MSIKITVCVIYPRYPDNTEPLGGFVESEDTAREIDKWWRAQPGDMIGTWEAFEVEAERATKPKSMWAANNGPRKYVLPFRLGWKYDKYFPDGKPWPPDKL